MGGFNASRSGFNPENVLTPANVGGVTEQWNATLPLSDPGQSGPSGMMPAVSNGVVYVTHNLNTSNNNAGRLYHVRRGRADELHGRDTELRSALEHGHPDQ